MDLAWFTTKSNEVGLHEFADWVKVACLAQLVSVIRFTRD